MTEAATRLYPSALLSPRSAFSVLLLAEGFTAAQHDSFVTLCHSFLATLRSTTPFNVLRYRQRSLMVWRHFAPSVVAGPALGATPGDTTFRSQLDSATNTLTLDDARVTAALDEIVLPSPAGGPGHPSWLLATRPAHLLHPGVVAIVLPASVDGAPVSAEVDANIRSEDASAPAYVATTTDSRWERVLVRAIARGLLLGDEYSRPEPEFGAPSTGTAARLSLHPNLLQARDKPTGMPTPTFKWWPHLDAAARTKPLAEFPYTPTPAAPPDGVQLHEGGGEYRAGIYRPGPDCLMRRRIGGPALSSPKADAVGFCTVCTRYLTELLAGTTSARPRRTIDNQMLAFDEVALWKHVRKIEAFPHVDAVTTRTAAPGPYWTYELKAGPDVGGLRIEKLELRGRADTRSSDRVADVIEFRDLVVEFNNTERVPFDFSRAFRSSERPPVLLRATDGHAGDLALKTLHGIKLTLEDRFEGRCRVQVELSLTLKAEAPDIDPAGVPLAAKFYPQIASRWFAEGPKAVTSMRGCVRMLFNNGYEHGPVEGIHEGSMGHGETGSPDVTIVNLFTDSNTAGAHKRESELLVPAIASWWVAFDYGRPNLTHDTEFVGVNGPGSPPEKRKFRKRAHEWPPGSGYPFEVQKDPDQGAYDNVHIHGSMGADPHDPAGGPMVHAPGCAEACVHLHWRWGPLAGTPLSGRFMYFWGWEPREYDGSEAFARPGFPLIPPNQRLVVAITHPGTTRGDPNGPVVTGTLRALDSKRKAVWYTVDISGPADTRQQVILEQGLSYAYEYDMTNSALRLSIYLARRFMGLPDSMSDNEVLHNVYSFNRWFLDPSGATPPVEQVPRGTLSSGGVSLADF